MRKLALIIAAAFAVSLPLAVHAQPKKNVAAPPVKLATTQVQQNPILLLQSFTASDLQAALADANAQTPPDTTAAACYTELLKIVNGGITSPLPAGPGAFQLLQKARDAKAMLANLQSSNGPLQSLNNACAPVVLDAQNTLLLLGGSVGLVALPTGAAGLLAILPK